MGERLWSDGWDEPGATTMLPVMDARQVRNRQLRSMGITPSAGYHFRGIGPMDEVELLLVHAAENDSAFEAKRLHGVVRAVVDHGHYKRVAVSLSEEPVITVVTLHSDGPPDWGVIEFRVTKKVWQPLEPDPGRM